MTFQFKTLCLSIFLVTLAACGGDDGSIGNPGLNGYAALLIQNDLLIGDTDCPYGGVEVGTGIDANGNAALDDDEITRTQTVCNGAPGIDGVNGADGNNGDTGAQGLQGIVGEDGRNGLTGATGTPGIQGLQGIQGGVGAQGTQGIQGVTGADGSDGFTALVTQQDLPVGDPDCADGGVKIFTGLDDDGDLILGTPEIDQTYTVCNGADGTVGAQGIQGLQGIQGEVGAQGIQGIVGEDGRNGLTGATGTPGIQGLQGIQGVAGAQGSQGIQGVTGADGSDGFTALVTQQDLPIGDPDCADGGVKIFTGLDDDGDLILGTPEIDQTYTVCNGADGTVGAQGIQGLQGIQGEVGAQGIQGIVGEDGRNGLTGATGTPGIQGLQGIQGVAGAQGSQGIQGVAGADGSDGLYALVAQQDLLVGDPNCAEGGIKVDMGLDDNSDLILDALEIDKTYTVCNGADGSDGTNGSDGANGVSGTEGIQGVAGNDGAEGAVGDQGAVGAQGNDGANGADGNQGMPGADGAMGPQGIPGANGAGGTDGLNSLIKITAVTAGINCANGGQRIDTGIDDYINNNVLEDQEIDSTAYICNAGSSSSTNTSDRYTKISDAGAELARTDYDWDCVFDSETNLMWEKKTNDGSLRDRDWRYAWYDTNPATNGGEHGIGDTGVGTTTGWENGNYSTITGSNYDYCYDSARCDTEKFVEDINVAQLCGYANWRLPTLSELSSLRDFSYNPNINGIFFPNTPPTVFWSSTSGLKSKASSINYTAHYMSFINNSVNSNVENKSGYSHVRLVRTN